MVRVGRSVVQGRPAKYRQVGTGPPLVIVHGLALSSTALEDHLRLLAGRGIRAIAPDLPGFGGTPGPRAGVGVKQAADWLIAFADAIGLERASWCGHSLAAQVAIDLAARRPERTRALVLASPAGAAERFMPLRQLAALVRDVPRESRAVFRSVLPIYARTSPVKILGTWARSVRHDPLPQATRIGAPTLIIAGDRDPVARSTIRLLRLALPDARLCLVPGGAHGVVFSHPAEFVHATAEFLHAIPN